MPVRLRKTQASASVFSNHVGSRCPPSERGLRSDRARHRPGSPRTGEQAERLHMVRERFLRGGRLHLVEKRTDVGALIGGKGPDGFEDLSDGRYRIVEDSVR